MSELAVLGGYLCYTGIIYLALIVTELAVGFIANDQNCDEELFMTRSSWLITSGFSRLGIGIFSVIMLIIILVYMASHARGEKTKHRVRRVILTIIYLIPNIFLELVWPIAGIYLTIKSETCYTGVNIDAAILASSVISIIHLISSICLMGAIAMF